MKETKPTQEQVVQAMIRTAKRLQKKFAQDPDDPFSARIEIDEPFWLGWVVGFRHEGEMFLATPFYRLHIWKLTPAGNILWVPKEKCKQLFRVVKRLEKKEKEDGTN